MKQQMNILTLFSNSFLPHIILPTRIRNNSKTLIDNIFSNNCSSDILSGKLSATVSDHLPQFLISPYSFNNPPAMKSMIFERDWSKFDKENFVLDYFEKNWNSILDLQENDVDNSFQNFLDEINDLLSKHAPEKRLSKQKLKFKSRPWITSGIQKSISVRNTLSTKHIKLKDPLKKAEVYEKYRQYRNLISTLLKKSKQSYFTNFFQENLYDLKNTWEGIKKLFL